MNDVSTSAISGARVRRFAAQAAALAALVALMSHYPALPTAEAVRWSGQVRVFVDGHPSLGARLAHSKTVSYFGSGKAQVLAA